MKLWSDKKVYTFDFQDVLRNENLKLDWDFKVSLLTDLVRVSEHTGARGMLTLIIMECRSPRIQAVYGLGIMDPSTYHIQPEFSG